MEWKQLNGNILILNRGSLTNLIYFSMSLSETSTNFTEPSWPDSMYISTFIYFHDITEADDASLVNVDFASFQQKKRIVSASAVVLI